MVAEHTDALQPNDSNGVLSFPALLDLLGFTDTEFVSISHQTEHIPFNSAICSIADAATTVADLPNEADIWFGVNPVPPKKHGRGKNGDVERVSALIADLDFAPGKCRDLATANAIIDDLSEILGVHPAAITHSGGGLHPYWAVTNGYSVLYGLASLYKRWRRLVEMVAKNHGAHVDNVFDLARVLRVPGTFNNKAATNGHGPIPVVCHRAAGRSLRLADVDKRLCAYGIREILDFPEETEFNSDPNKWGFAEETCFYAAPMIDGWAKDANLDGLELGRGRHQWFLSQAVRLGCAKRLGCVTEADYEHAKDVVTTTLIHLCSSRQPVRKVPPGEIRDGFRYGTEKAATKTEDEARGELGGHVHDDYSKTKKDPIFREYGPTEWAKPVEPTRFFIKQVLCADTWGVNGGPEKSLKTHDNFALAMSIATGINLYRSDLFPVLRQGKALIIIGEGGEKQILRLLHRMCRAYGIRPEDVLKDPAFPLWLEFGVAPLNSDALRDEIKELLARHQPDYVSMESFYNFHPVEVSAANLYERGQVIDSYHKLVRESGNDVVSMLTDHNKKGANELGLRHISMSGQAENSDSWIQRIHRRDPDVVGGEFCLTTSFNSRNWGGSTFDVDWHLGPFDHDAGSHTGDISWDVCPHKGDANGGDSSVKIDIGILVRDNPWKYNRQEIFEKLRPIRKLYVYTAIKKMVDEGELNEESPKLHGHGGKAVVIGPGPKLAALIGKVVAHGGGRTP